MKLITLRIDEEEKARLEYMAQRGDITLSRALREGASLYLNELQARRHKARGGDVTFHGVRRDAMGEQLGAGSAPLEREVAQLQRLRSRLYDGAFRAIVESGEADARLRFAALAHWLDIVGDLYAGAASYVGWSWFVRDYCPGYAERSERDALQSLVERGAMDGADGGIEDVLAALEGGFLRFLRDAEHQEAVRRAVLATWTVIERRLS